MFFPQTHHLALTAIDLVAIGAVIPLFTEILGVIYVKFGGPYSSGGGHRFRWGQVSGFLGANGMSKQLKVIYGVKIQYTPPIKAAIASQEAMKPAKPTGEILGISSPR